MMKLILIRHGDAGAYTLPDEMRQLSELGKQQASETAQWLKNNYTVNQWISSPYLRAVQTMTVLQTAATPTPAMQIVQGITPNDNAREAIDILQNQIDKNSDVVVVVCHMNVIAHIVQLLTDTRAVPFHLAEARVLSGEWGIGLGAMQQVDGFIPTISLGKLI